MQLSRPTPKSLILPTFLFLLFGLAGPLVAEDFATRAEALLEEMRSRPLLDPGGTGKLPYGPALARLAADPDDAEALNYVANGGLGGEPPFNALYQIRGYLMNPDRYSASQAESIEDSGKLVEEWNLDYTENHKVLLWSNAYLYAQAFPDGQWMWNGLALNSADLISAARQTIMEYGKSVFDRGYSDLLSPTYDLYKVSAWMNLYDFAEDEGVRDMADAMLTYHFTLLALASYGEVILPPQSRARGTIMGKGLTADSQWINWLFWGFGGNGAMEAARESSPEWIPALTTWRPPAAIGQIARGELPMPYSFRTQQPFFFEGPPRHMVRTTWRDVSFALSSGVYRMDMDALSVHGARQLVYDDPFAIAWESESSLACLSVMHPYWEGASGENDWTSRSSPFLQVGQHENTAIVLFDIPVADPWADIEPWSGERAAEPLKIAEIRYPYLGATFMDWGDDWISLDMGSAYIAIKILQPGWVRDRRILQTEGFHVIKSAGTEGEPWKTGFLFEVVGADEVESLEAFMTAVKAEPLTVNLADLGVTYTTQKGDVLDMQFTVSLEVPEFSVPGFSVNGTPVDYADWPHMESPWTRLEGRILSLGGPVDPQVYTVDWSGNVPILEMRDRSDPTTWAGWPIQENGWVDTGSFLGWVYPVGDFLFIQDLGKYVYLPESHVGPGGAWMFIPGSGSP